MCQLRLQNKSLDLILKPHALIEIRRLNRRVVRNGVVEYVSFTTINIKFAGQTLPRQVYLFYDAHEVTPFVPRIKTCFSCYKIGHIHKYCKSRSRCKLYGKDAHNDGDVCKRQDLPPICELFR